MKNKNVEVIFEPTGQVHMEAFGFRGIDCQVATAFLEEALGKITCYQRKPEYYESARPKLQQRIGL